MRLLILALLSGCATIPQDILIADKDDVQECRLVGTVTNDFWHNSGLEQAYANAMDRAGREGADTVVVIDSGGGVNNFYVLLHAYDCKGMT